MVNNTGKMKKIFQITVILLSAIVCSSCLFDYDNYDGPNATLKGAITDMQGNPLNVEAGGGIRIKLLDYGSSENPKEQYLKVKMDGTYINTKIFESTYDIVAEGPFVPLVQIDDEGNVIVDNTRKGVKVSGTTEVNFQVEPFLKVEWDAEPTFVNGIMTASFKITRGTEYVDYQKDVYDVGLFVSTTQYVGENNYDSRISVKEADKAVATAMIGNSASLTTLSTYPMLSGHTYYIRVGARMDYAFSFGSSYLYNYTNVKKIVVPTY